MPWFVLAVAPSLGLFLLFYLRDKYEKEPLGLLLKTFLMGALTVIPVGMAEHLLFNLWGVDLNDASNLWTFLLMMVFLVALIEEVAKFAVVRFYVWNKKAFNEPYDGIMYAVMASLGFATIENILYVMMFDEVVAWLRALLTVPLHVLVAVIMGYYVGLAKYSPHGTKHPDMYTGLWLAIFFHGLFNFLVASEVLGLILMAPLLVAWVWRLGLKASRLEAEASPFKN